MRPQNLAIPQLPSRNVEKTLAFYARLGFVGEIASPMRDYAIAERGPFEIHFFLHSTLVPAQSCFSCYLRVAAVDSLYREFALAGLPRVGIPRLEPVEDKPWGMREFAVVDEDGNLIRVGQVIGR